MLDEFRVQFPGRGAALSPVEDELGDGVFYELPLDPAALHDLHGIEARAPTAVQPGGFRRAEGFRLILLVVAPVADHVLAELVFPGVAGFAPLAPVKDEIFQLVEGELARYVVVETQ